jgi:hypothetical protein
VGIVRPIYEANARRDVAAALGLIDPEIEVEYRGQLIDKYAAYHGHAAGTRSSSLETRAR